MKKVEFLSDILSQGKMFKNKSNRFTDVYYVENSGESAFAECSKRLLENGYIKRKESYFGEGHLFEAFEGNGEGLFLNFFKNTNTLSLVLEKDCRYFEFSDNLGPITAKPQITQVHLEDFGMSYVVRLSDSRFIVIDGGREFEPDADRLYECLKSGTEDEKPVIAAWIMTHPHSDHFHCFMKFWDKYGKDVAIERFLYNFPEHDDEEHYPAIKKKDWRFEDSSIYTNIPLMEKRVVESGAKVYMPHTGQRYTIGDAVIEILSSIDDTVHKSQNVNAASLVMRMVLGGQVILWSADASYSDAMLVERYSSYLKADILQIPHHGFQSGSFEAEIAGYEIIKPKVCFLPVSEYNAYIAFCANRPSARHIMERMDIDELITGDITRTITLPYTAPASAKYEYKQKLSDGVMSNGSKSWVYMGLNTSVKEDFEYSVLNMTHSAARVWVEIYYEGAADIIRYITINLSPMTYKNVNIVGEEADGDALFFNWMSLKSKGVPENKNFAVRFLSDMEIVVKHKIHKEAYHM